jgi:hypothetical protein
MKRTIIILTLVALMGCGNNNQTSPKEVTSVYWLPDLTDDIQHTAIDEVKGLYGLKERTDRGAEFTIQSITDAEYAPSASLSLPPQPLLFQNPGQRMADIDSFLASVGRAAEGVCGKTTNKPRSEVFSALIHALGDLSKERQEGRADKLFLICESDLGENEEYFSVYRDRDLVLLEQNPSAVEEILSRYGRIPDLHSISIRFSYRAKNYSDGKRYGLMAALLRRMIERAGGSVIVTGGDINGKGI